MTETTSTTDTTPQPSRPSTWQPCGTCGQRHDPRADHTGHDTTAAAQPLDPIGYDDSLLVRAALLMFADHIADKVADLDQDSPYREPWARDLIRTRWLSGRSWYGALLSPGPDANDRDDALRQLQVLTAGVSA